MSLPAGFLDELRTRLSLAQVAGRKVVWDMRKSNQARGDWWAPCPFHHEKTASFHVDEQKGFYYCFGCHAKGDVFSFVRESENVGFMEAVRMLAVEAGMELPERDPEAQQKADRRSQLAEVMEQALRHFRLMLNSGAGAAARDYLARRGLDQAALERWEIGFAPDEWQGLWDRLRGQGVAEDLIFGAGLARPSRKGGNPYDVFRGRIMFPIRDGRGRCIAFGGRAMSPDDPAKYLNSPETELFDKGRSLFNHGPARAAVGKGQALIVAEGYMDVIALAGAGFEGAVAPLGTAITEHQLALLWRIAPEPVIALDGDKAGLRAAYRLMDLALPLLEAGRSLRFALMPEGQDPDDLLRAQGRETLGAVLEGAVPLVQLLWRRETEGRIFDSPDRRAALDKRLREQISAIRDTMLRGHYERAIRDLSWAHFARRPARQGWRDASPAAPAPGTRRSLLASGTLSGEALREAVVLAVLIRSPEIVPEFLDDLEEMTCAEPGHEALRAEILAQGEAMSEQSLAAALGEAALTALFAHPHLAVIPALRQRDPVMARLCVQSELAQLAAERGHARELAEALEDLADGGGEHVVRRLAQSGQARQRASQRGVTEDETRFDLGENGHPIDRAERQALDDLLRSLTEKPEKPR